MVWFKVNDNLAIHPKAVAAGNRALGLWVRAGAWSGAHLTDGRIPANVIGILGGTITDAKKLVEAGLWTRTGDGYQFHGWDEMNPTREQMEAKRAAAAARKAKSRTRHLKAVGDPEQGR